MMVMIGFCKCGPMFAVTTSGPVLLQGARIYPMKTEITTHFSLLSQKKLNVTKRQKNEKATTQRAKISYFSTKKKSYLQTTQISRISKEFPQFFLFLLKKKKKKLHSFCNDELSGALWSDCFALSITRSHFCLSHTHAHAVLPAVR